MFNLRQRFWTFVKVVDGFGRWRSGLFDTLSPSRTHLHEFKGEARPLLIFADDARHPDFCDQISELKEAAGGLRERDMVVLSDTNPVRTSHLRDKLDVKHRFEIVLIGKDGEVKLRRSKPLTADLLFSIIDRMPMRRQEMRG